MTIEYFAREVYGKKTLYVADQGLAYTISALTGKKTIDEKDVQALTELGLEMKHIDYWSVKPTK